MNGASTLALPRGDRDYVFLKQTTSTCPECLALVTARVVVKDGKVYFKKRCPAHGESTALVEEDARAYLDAYRFARAGTIPLRLSTDVKRGCPYDCGLCGDHEQHTCVPIIEVNDHCNLDCPICIVDNRESRQMEVGAFRDMIGRLVAHEGTLDAVTLSGGEPSVHPRIAELLEAARRPEIARVTIVTNGIRIARDDTFARLLKELGVYVILQLDGFSASSHIKLRGRDLSSEKRAAIDALRALGIPTQILFVPVRGVNEHEIGQAVKLLLAEEFILSLVFQPVALIGGGGAAFPHDPLNRITVSGVVKAIAEQTGVLAPSDFFPLPCSHPHCVTLTYLLRLDDGSFVPFPRFAKMENYLDLFRGTATIGASEGFDDVMNDVINQLWTSAGEIPDCEKVSRAMKRALGAIFPPSGPLAATERHRAAERQAKSIFIHHYMDRFNFDLERLRKCCHHYPLEDGRIMPACSYNLFHRGAALPMPANARRPR